MKIIKNNKKLAVGSLKFATAAFALVLLLTSNLQLPSSVSAQTLTSPAGAVDPTQSSFKIISCDGPAIPKGQTVPPGYVVCDFNGAMKQIQHLIDIAMVIGVFAAIVLFTYAGYLMMTGKEDDRKRAYGIFPKIVWGFVIMASAWFLIYQILSWLTGNSGFTKLLGSP